MSNTQEWKSTKKKIREKRKQLESMHKIVNIQKVGKKKPKSIIKIKTCKK